MYGKCIKLKVIQYAQQVTLNGAKIAENASLAHPQQLIKTNQNYSSS